MDYLPYILLGLALLFNWVNKKAVPFIFGLSAVSAFFQNRIEFLGIGIFLLAWLSFWMWRVRTNTHIALKTVFCILFFSLGFGLFSHIVPGFNNLLVFDGHRFSENSAPFNMYINFDKPLISIIALYYLSLNKGFLQKGYLKTIPLITAVAIILLLGPAFALGYTKFQFKIEWKMLIWFFNNLIFVCVAEEVIFRRIIQNDLFEIFKGKSLKYAGLASIVVAGFLFGLAHYKGGINYIVLSTLAGFCYGYAYHKYRALDASVMVHVGVNTFHLVFLTYPFSG
jgi:membrane protease YdiL (CAAX protease family)